MIELPCWWIPWYNPLAERHHLPSAHRSASGCSMSPGAWAGRARHSDIQAQICLVVWNMNFMTFHILGFGHDPN